MTLKTWKTLVIVCMAAPACTAVPVRGSCTAIDALAAAAPPPTTTAPTPVTVPHGRVGIEPESPGAWVERIVAMRAAGNDAAAELELAALARRYPDFRIPDRARAASDPTSIPR